MQADNNTNDKLRSKIAIPLATIECTHRMTTVYLGHPARSEAKSQNPHLQRFSGTATVKSFLMTDFKNLHPASITE